MKQLVRTGFKRPCYCFVDTNVFLHYQFFPNIDWAMELDEEYVALIVCAQVLGELEKQKFLASYRKIQERAKKTVSRLAEIQRENKQIRDNVELLFIIDEPVIDWASEGLDPDVGDDRVIAAILCEKGNKAPIVLVSSDLGLQLKAEARGIRWHQLSNTLMLEVSKTPEEEEMAKLRKEIAVLKSKAPKLCLKLASEEELKDFMPFHLRGYHPMSDKDIRNELHEANMKNAHGNPLWDKDDVERYARDLGKYLKQLQEYLEENRRYGELLSRTIEIRLMLVNDGTAPAEDIDISLKFCSGFTLCHEDDLLKQPMPPEEPMLPRMQWEMSCSPTKALKSTDDPRTIKPETETQATTHTRPSIVNNNGYEVTFSYSKIKQHIPIKFSPVYAIFPSVESAKSFHIDYSIIADNVPEKIEGQLHIVLKETV